MTTRGMRVCSSQKAWTRCTLGYASPLVLWFICNTCRVMRPMTLDHTQDNTFVALFFPLLLILASSFYYYLVMVHIYIYVNVIHRCFSNTIVDFLQSKVAIPVPVYHKLISSQRYMVAYKKNITYRCYYTEECCQF